MNALYIYYIKNSDCEVRWVACIKWFNVSGMMMLIVSEDDVDGLHAQREIIVGFENIRYIGTFPVSI